MKKFDENESTKEVCVQPSPLPASLSTSRAADKVIHTTGQAELVTYEQWHSFSSVGPPLPIFSGAPRVPSPCGLLRASGESDALQRLKEICSDHFRERVDGPYLHSVLQGPELLWIQGLISPAALLEAIRRMKSSAIASLSPNFVTDILEYVSRVEYCRHACRHWCLQLTTDVSDGNAPWLDMFPYLQKVLSATSSVQCTTSTVAKTALKPLQFPGEICHAKTSNKLFNALQTCLFDSGVPPKGLAAKYWLGYFMSSLPSAATGLSVALLETSRNSLVKSDDICGILLPLLLSASELVQEAADANCTISEHMGTIEEEMTTKYGKIFLDHFCTRFI